MPKSKLKTNGNGDVYAAKPAEYANVGGNKGKCQSTMEIQPQLSF
jgi:hypothetical protein